jgi:hypothetical protein
MSESGLSCVLQVIWELNWESIWEPVGAKWESKFLRTKPRLCLPGFLVSLLIIASGQNSYASLIVRFGAGFMLFRA